MKNENYMSIQIKGPKMKSRGTKGAKSEEALENSRPTYPSSK